MYIFLTYLPSQTKLHYLWINFEREEILMSSLSLEFIILIKFFNSIKLDLKFQYNGLFQTIIVNPLVHRIWGKSPHKNNRCSSKVMWIRWNISHRLFHVNVSRNVGHIFKCIEEGRKLFYGAQFKECKQWNCKK